MLFREEKFGRWILDNDKIRRLEITKDIEEVIIKQVDSLDDDDRKILELISCFGGSIKYHILKALVINNPHITPILNYFCLNHKMLHTCFI